MTHMEPTYAICASWEFDFVSSMVRVWVNRKWIFAGTLNIAVHPSSSFSHWKRWVCEGCKVMNDGL